MRTLRVRRPARLSLLATPLAIIAIGALVAPAAACPHASSAGRPAALAASRVTPAYSWAPSATGTTARFRGLAAVNGRTAWVAGFEATILRTTDGGASWQDVSPPADQSQGTTGLLQFRDIEATDAQNAVALAIGEGTDSRLARRKRHWIGDVEIVVD